VLYTFGNSDENILVGPGTKQIDISMFKNFSFGEARRLEFRCGSVQRSEHATVHIQTAASDQRREDHQRGSPTVISARRGRFNWR